MVCMNPIFPIDLEQVAGYTPHVPHFAAPSATKGNECHDALVRFHRFTKSGFLAKKPPHSWVSTSAGERSPTGLAKAYSPTAAVA